MSKFLLKFASLMALVIVLANISSASSRVQGVEASGTIYIRTDGSVDPPTASVTTSDNMTYTLIDNITSSSDGIIVERDNITIDGDQYTVWGPHDRSLDRSTYGINLDGRSNVTIRNTIISGFTDGVEAVDTNEATISGNNITANDIFGIYLGFSSSNNNISGNSVANNEWGIYLYISSDNKFYHNNFVNNTHQVYVDRSLNNAWDGGYPEGGNYWSDYNGTDSHSGRCQNETGFDWIGDSQYIINQNNTDRYPLMNPFVPETEEIRIAYRSLLIRDDEMSSELQESIDSLKGQINSLSQAFESLNQSTTSLQEQYDSLSYQLSTILSVFGAVIVILFATTAYLATRKPKTKPETKKENQAQ
jgi:parallel beta-helix repeat protein